ncbi:MAG: hypothetical protein SFW35_11165 [Chitinophagales bacterium]|nr:hypothetical protein [Chitinophagales bacterium]
MFRIQILLFFLFALALNVTAQNKKTSDGPGLKESLEWLKKNIVEVKSGGFTIIQKFEYDAADPCKVIYTRTETNSKGISTTFRYEFTLKDIDPYSVNYVLSGTRINVNFFVKNRQRVIQAFRNDVVQKYEFNLSFVAVDVEAARKLVDGFKHTVELCNNQKSDWYSK